MQQDHGRETAWAFWACQEAKQWRSGFAIPWPDSGTMWRYLHQFVGACAWDATKCREPQQAACEC